MDPMHPAVPEAGGMAQSEKGGDDVRAQRLQTTDGPFAATAPPQQQGQATPPAVLASPPPMSHEVALPVDQDVALSHQPSEAKLDGEQDRPGDILPDDIANVAPAAVNSAEKAAARARLKKFMLCGGGVEDIGKLGGMELESFFRITHASIKLFIVCSVLGIPLLAVNWSRADNSNRFLQGLLNYPIVLDRNDRTDMLYFGLNFIAFIATVIFLIAIPFTVQRGAREADLMRTTPSDFTVLAKGFPGNVDEDAIAEFFSRWGPISLVTLVRRTRRLRALKKELEKLTAFGPKKSETAAAHAERLELLRTAMQKTAQGGLASSGTAFIVFKDEYAAKECLELMNRSRAAACCRVFSKLRYEVKPKFMNMYALDVKRAPEPSNVNWDNAENSWEFSFRRHCIAAFLMACLVGLSFVAIVFISIKAIEENSAVESTAFRRGVASFAAPGTIMLINWVIGFTARKLAKWEGHATYEGEQVSSLTKRSVAQVLNSVVIMVVIHWGEEREWFFVGDTNLGTKALELVAMNTFLPSLLSFLYWGFMKVFNTVIRNPIYHCLKWRVVEAKPLMPEISGWYAAIIKTFALGMLFGPISPAVYPLSVISFLILHAQHKSSFLLFELEFPEMFERVSTRAMDILTLLGVLYIFVSMVIAARLGGNVAFALGMLALVVLLVKVVIPINWVERLEWRISGRETDLLHYKRVRERMQAGKIRTLTEEEINGYRSFADEYERVASGEHSARHLSGRVGSARGIRSDRGALRAYEGASAIAMFCCGPLCSKNPCITPVRYRSQPKTFELHLAPISESNPTTPVIPSAPAAPTHEAGDLESKATPV